ncbi:MAG: hypothetical protein RMK30_04515 [Anaerolineae bacterium]|nr:hypothetical protein [Anaerolineae bacterium]MDW8102125.1 hypothetical protein [Anaerolineae bacterium]
MGNRCEAERFKVHVHIEEATIRRLERVEGVKEVIAAVYDALEEIREGVQVGMINMVVGVPPERAQLFMEPVSLQEGH